MKDLLQDKEMLKTRCAGLETNMQMIVENKVEILAEEIKKLTIEK